MAPRRQVVCPQFQRSRRTYPAGVKIERPRQPSFIHHHPNDSKIWRGCRQRAEPIPPGLFHIERQCHDPALFKAAVQLRAAAPHPAAKISHLLRMDLAVLSVRHRHRLCFVALHRNFSGRWPELQPERIIGIRARIRVRNRPVAILPQPGPELFRKVNSPPLPPGASW